MRPDVLLGAWLAISVSILKLTPSLRCPMPRTPALALTGFALVAAGCAAVAQSTRLASTPAEPRPATAPVAVFSSQQPKCAYDEVALVSVKPMTKLTSSEKLIDALRDRARKEGADALINVKLDTPVNGASLNYAGSVDVERTRVLTGTAIRFRDPNCAQ